jgi:hypothetical protein
MEPHNSRKKKKKRSPFQKPSPIAEWQVMAARNRPEKRPDCAVRRGEIPDSCPDFFVFFSFSGNFGFL